MEARLDADCLRTSIGLGAMPIQQNLQRRSTLRERATVLMLLSRSTSEKDSSFRRACCRHSEAGRPRHRSVGRIRYRRWRWPGLRRAAQASLPVIPPETAWTLRQTVLASSARERIAEQEQTDARSHHRPRRRSESTRNRCRIEFASRRSPRRSVAPDGREPLTGVFVIG